MIKSSAQILHSIGKNSTQNQQEHCTELPTYAK